MRRIVLFFACIAALAVSCVHEEAPQEPRTSYVLSGLTLSDEMQEATRSVFTGDDGQITSITLFAFDSDGNIMIYGDDAGSAYAGKRIEQYAEEGGEIEWLLPISEEPYDIYAVANLGDFRGRFSTVDELVSSPDMEWSSELLSSSSDVGIPMRAILEGVTGGQDYTLPMRRVVARFDLTLRNFDSGRLIWFDICNVNATVNVFGVNECADADDMADLHEYATEQDIETLNAGGTVSFYVPENMQTTAGNYSLTGNTDWTMTAEKLAKSYGLSQASDAECTYVRITLKRDSEEFPSEYFLYLGDGRNNFDVERGKKKNITANVGGDKRKELKISISDGFHEAGELYAASKVRAVIEFSPEQASAWSEGFTVQSKDLNGNDVISWDTPVKTGDNSYEVSGVCKKVSESASLEFVNSNGRVTDIKSIAVKKPGIMLMNSAPRVTGETVVKWSGASVVSSTINTSTNMMFVYLVDDSGFNLNQGYGVDASCLDFTSEVVSSDESCIVSCGDVITGNISGSSEAAVGYYVAYLTQQVQNDGTDPERNRMLTWMAGSSKSTLVVKEPSLGIQFTLPHSVVIPKITISMVEHPYLAAAEITYKIDNKSKLPFRFSGLRFHAGDQTSSSNQNEYNISNYGRLVLPWDFGSPDEVNKAFFVQKVDELSFNLESGEGDEYLYDSVYYIDDPLYGSWQIPVNVKNLMKLSSIRCMGGTRSFVHDGMYDYLHASLVYPQFEMWSAEEVFSVGSVLPRTDDNKWGEVQDKGMTLYGVLGVPMESSNVGSGYDFSGIVPDVLETSEMIEFIDSDIVEVEVYFNDDNELVAVASEPVSVQINVSGYIYSHIRTIVEEDLLGDSHEYHKDVQAFGSGGNTFTLSTTPKVIDNNAVNDAFVKIRNKVFWSYVEALEDAAGNLYSTNYREHLKPYDFELSLYFHSIDKPISVKFPENFSISYDYKKSPAVVWPHGFLGSITTQPSADSRFYPDCSECGDPDKYKEETVSMIVKGYSDLSHSDILDYWYSPLFAID